MGKEKIEVKLQYSSSIFEYEYKITDKQKRNINKECASDYQFFKALIIKLRIKPEILNTDFYTENEKLKLLQYFSKTLQGHR